jgi:hypothetical protein
VHARRRAGMGGSGRCRSMSERAGSAGNRARSRPSGASLSPSDHGPAMRRQRPSSAIGSDVTTVVRRQNGLRAGELRWWVGTADRPSRTRWGGIHRLRRPPPWQVAATNVDRGHCTSPGQRKPGNVARAIRPVEGVPLDVVWAGRRWDRPHRHRVTGRGTSSTNRIGPPSPPQSRRRRRGIEPAKA